MVLLANTSPTYELEFVGSAAYEAGFHSSGLDHWSAASNRGAELSCEFPLEANAHFIDWRQVELCRIAGNARRVGKIGIDARAANHRWTPRIHYLSILALCALVLVVAGKAARHEHSASDANSVCPGSAELGSVILRADSAEGLRGAVKAHRQNVYAVFAYGLRSEDDVGTCPAELASDAIEAVQTVRNDRPAKLARIWGYCEGVVHAGRADRRARAGEAVGQMTRAEIALLSPGVERVYVADALGADCRWSTKAAVQEQLGTALANTGKVESVSRKACGTVRTRWTGWAVTHYLIAKRAASCCIFAVGVAGAAVTEALICCAARAIRHTIQTAGRKTNLKGTRKTARTYWRSSTSCTTRDRKRTCSTREYWVDCESYIAKKTACWRRAPLAVWYESRAKWAFWWVNCIVIGYAWYTYSRRAAGATLTH